MANYREARPFVSQINSAVIFVVPISVTGCVSMGTDLHRLSNRACRGQNWISLRFTAI